MANPNPKNQFQPGDPRAGRKPRKGGTVRWPVSSGPEDRELADSLAEKLGTTRSGVVVLALKALAEAEGI